MWKALCKAFKTKRSGRAEAPEPPGVHLPNDVGPSEDGAQAEPLHAEEQEVATATGDGVLLPVQSAPSPPTAVLSIIGQRREMEDAWSTACYLTSLRQDVAVELADKLPVMFVRNKSGRSAAPGLPTSEDRDGGGLTEDTGPLKQVSDMEQQPELPAHFFALFDGHGGTGVSHHCSRVLHDHLRAALDSCSSRGHIPPTSPDEHQLLAATTCAAADSTLHNNANGKGLASQALPKPSLRFSQHRTLIEHTLSQDGVNMATYSSSPERWSTASQPLPSAPGARSGFSGMLSSAGNEHSSLNTAISSICSTTSSSQLSAGIFSSSSCGAAAVCPASRLAGASGSSTSGQAAEPDDTAMSRQAGACLNHPSNGSHGGNSGTLPNQENHTSDGDGGNSGPLPGEDAAPTDRSSSTVGRMLRENLASKLALRHVPNNNIGQTGAAQVLALLSKPPTRLSSAPNPALTLLGQPPRLHSEASGLRPHSTGSSRLGSTRALVSCCPQPLVVVDTAEPPEASPDSSSSTLVTLPTFQPSLEPSPANSLLLHNGLSASCSQRHEGSQGAVKKTTSCCAACVEAALVQAFHQTDASLVTAGVRSQDQGTCAVVALLGADTLWLANAGDSRAVLCRQGAAVVLTSDHKACRQDETARVQAAGGHVWWNRVMGELAVSRAIGDHALRPYVIAEPEITRVRRRPTDQLLLMASDGLWDVVGNQEACDIALTTLAIYEAKGRGPTTCAKKVAATLIKTALARGSKDNVTVVVVDLRGGAADEEHASGPADGAAGAAGSAAGGSGEMVVCRSPSPGPSRDKMVRAVSTAFPHQGRGGVLRGAAGTASDPVVALHSPAPICADPMAAHGPSRGAPHHHLRPGLRTHQHRPAHHVVPPALLAPAAEHAAAMAPPTSAEAGTSERSILSIAVQEAVPGLVRHDMNSVPILSPSLQRFMAQRTAQRTANSGASPRGSGHSLALSMFPLAKPEELEPLPLSDTAVHLTTSREATPRSGDRGRATPPGGGRVPSPFSAPEPSACFVLDGAWQAVQHPSHEFQGL